MSHPTPARGRRRPRHAASIAAIRGTGQRLTPGYWKNHETETTALLPQSLGSYTNDSTSTSC